MHPTILLKLHGDTIMQMSMRNGVTPELKRTLTLTVTAAPCQKVSWAGHFEVDFLCRLNAHNEYDELYRKLYFCSRWTILLSPFVLYCPHAI